MRIFPIEMFRWTVYALLCGVAMGILYDVLRLSRVMLGYRYISSRSAIINNGFTQRFRNKNSIDISQKALFRVILFFEDVFFVCIYAILFELLLFYGNSGEFRIVFLIAILLGFFVYYFSLGRITILFFEVWVIYLRSLIGYALYYVLLPIRFITRKMLDILKKIIAFLKMTLENILIKRYNKKERTLLLELSKKGMI